MTTEQAATIPIAHIDGMLPWLWKSMEATGALPFFRRSKLVKSELPYNIRDGGESGGESQVARMTSYASTYAEVE